MNDQPADPLLVAIATLGAEIVRHQAEADAWRSSYDSAQRIASDAYRDRDEKAKQAEQLEERLGVARMRDAVLTEFVRGLAGGSNEGPIRSKAQAAARGLLNQIGWSPR